MPILVAGSLWSANAAESASPDLTKLPPPAARPIDYVRDIQPIFSENCYKCHGAEKHKSGFRLDQKDAALKGGDRGVDIVPGKSSASPLIHFVSGLVEDMQMPPAKGGAGPLSVAEIGLLRAWIDQSAVWPEAGIGQATLAKSDFWTFKPALRPPLPSPKAQGWARNDLDLFILAKLESEGLAPAPEADRRTLIRRASFDLTGLPPTPSEVHEFLTDTHLDAYERLVNRLLGSPRYGERWARHWLDTVHFGETHGYDKDKPRPNAWPYRDYVIRALNQDKPYSRFVQEQLAGDALYPDDPDGVVALGFIAAGPWDFVGHVELPESKTDGLIARYNDRDDMVMTTMSTFQSLTVHCARCHDHKFDPISQEDYYSLQAVFAGVDRADRWFDSDPAIYRARKELLAEKKDLETRQATLNERVNATSPTILKLVSTRLDELKKQISSLDKTAGVESPSNGYHSEISPRSETNKWVQIELADVVAIDEIRLVPARPTDFPDTPGFGFPVRFRVELSADGSFSQSEVLLDQTRGDYPNPGDKSVIVPATGHRTKWIHVTATRLWERTGDYVFALGELQVLAGGKNIAQGATVAALDSIESGRWAKRFLVDGFDSRKRLEEVDPALSAESLKAKRAGLEAEIQQLASERKAMLEKLLDETTRHEMADVENGLAKIEVQLKALPAPQKVFAGAHDFATTGSFHPAVEPRAVHVLRRGEVKQPIRLAEPGAVSCLPGMPARFQLSNAKDEGSRRAALAKWITDPGNMLTRRSIANRVWQYHFGRGIVDTPNDFGHMGSKPTHPELLDWVAFWFLDHGESLKDLHRLIMTSATYRQASTENARFAKIDADNRFLWHMNRSRLDAESLHDAMLMVSGQLDLVVGGPSVQQFYFKDDHSPVYDYSRFDINTAQAQRRSIYRFVVRSVPDPFMETLDCPDASLLAPKRTTTVTALQALTQLNDPIVLRQAEYFTQRLDSSGRDLPGRINLACELALGRPARPNEAPNLRAYAEKHGLVNLCRVLLNSSEFMFVD